MRKMQCSAKTECSWRVELAGRVEVGAERLLGDHPGALAEPELAELLDRPRRRLRWQREVEEQPGLLAQLLARRRDLRAERPRSPRRRRRSAATRRTAPRPRGRRPCGRSRRSNRAPARGTPRRSSSLAGGADDPEALRHQPHLREVEHPRQQLALGEVAGRAEEDDHLVVRGPPRLLAAWLITLQPMLPSRWRAGTTKNGSRLRPGRAGPGGAALLARDLGVGAGRGRRRARDRGARVRRRSR